ncbi:amino acid synthesis family protein [Actinophytocola sp.]|uniref:amino acid synthesis family protein n=1 Tax=Actinophytocola sp. TaxID=1872138 RepID=UPI003D6B5EF7
MRFAVRKWIEQVEEIVHDGGPPPGEPLRRAVAAAVVANPVAGRYVEDLGELVEPSDVLGEELGRRARALLAGRAVEGYGKAGMCGVEGEQEHVAACLTTRFGDGLRRGVGGGRAWLASTKKVGGAGESLDIPIAYRDHLNVRSHYDTVTLRVPDAPRPRELLIAVAVTSRGRVHARVGGLTRAEADRLVESPGPAEADA